jgi:pterin-4a-carbinolamine dehydratase
MMKPLTEIMSDYFDDEITVDAISNRVVPLQRSLPVIPKKKSSWEKISNPNRMHRTYTFTSKKEYYLFLSAITAHEQDVDHSAKIICSYPDVTIEVYTHDVNDITELDLEYSRDAEEIYRDVKDYSRYNEEDKES